MIQMKGEFREEQLKDYKKQLVALKENWKYFQKAEELRLKIDIDILCLVFLIEGLEAEKKQPFNQ